jgi:hypothetical protein
MYECMHICMYVSMNVCMYVCMYVWCLPVNRGSMPIQILREDTGKGCVDRKCLNQQTFRSDCCSQWHRSEHTGHNSQPVFVSNCYRRHKDKHLYCTALCKFNGDSAPAALTTHTTSM